MSFISYIQQIAVPNNIQMYTFQKGILVLLISALLQNYTFVIGQIDGDICSMNYLFIYFIV